MIHSDSSASAKLAGLLQAEANTSSGSTSLSSHILLSACIWEYESKYEINSPPLLFERSSTWANVSEWLVTEYNMVDKDTEVDLGVLLCVSGCALTNGYQKRHFKGSQRTVHREQKHAVTCTENLGEKRKSNHLFYCIQRRWTILSDRQYSAHGCMSMHKPMHVQMESC